MTYPKHCHLFFSLLHYIYFQETENILKNKGSVPPFQIFYFKRKNNNSE